MRILSPAKRAILTEALPDARDPADVVSDVDGMPKVPPFPAFGGASQVGRGRNIL